MLKSLRIACCSLVVGTSVFAGPLGIGRIAQPDEIAAWNTDIRPDGQGLPAGQGDVLTGEEVFVENCAGCHGDFGEGVGRYPALAGGQGTLTDDRPLKTIGSYLPYLSTVYDFIDRAMTVGYGPELSDDEIYAVIAYLLYSNDLVDEDFTLTRENFTQNRLPNEPNFIPDDRLTREGPHFRKPACMENCKADVNITSRAANVGQTSE